MAADPVIGIDLGTSNSVAAVVQDGQVVVIPDREGRRIHPSVVSFHADGSILVGEKAKRRRVIDPKNTIFSAKRLIGRRISSSEVRTAVARMPYLIKEGGNQQPMIEARSRPTFHPQISAMVLTHMKGIAEQQLGRRSTARSSPSPRTSPTPKRSDDEAAGQDRRLRGSCAS